MVGPIKLKIDLPIICKKKLLTTEDTQRESRSKQSTIEISYVNEMFVESIILCLIMQVGCCIYMNDSPFGSIKLRLVVIFVFLLILHGSH
jgi:hypothetical protein